MGAHVVLHPSSATNNNAVLAGGASCSGTTENNVNNNNNNWFRCVRWGHDTARLYFGIPVFQEGGIYFYLLVIIARNEIFLKMKESPFVKGFS